MQNGFPVMKESARDAAADLKHCLRLFELFLHIELFTRKDAAACLPAKDPLSRGNRNYREHGVSGMAECGQVLRIRVLLRFPNQQNSGVRKG